MANVSFITYEYCGGNDNFTSTIDILKEKAKQSSKPFEYVGCYSRDGTNGVYESYSNYIRLKEDGSASYYNYNDDTQFIYEIEQKFIGYWDIFDDKQLYLELILVKETINNVSSAIKFNTEIHTYDIDIQKQEITLKVQKNSKGCCTGSLIRKLEPLFPKSARK